MGQTRVAQLFLNLGHAFDHLFMLIFPTVVLAMAPEFGRSYGELLPLSLGGFIMFGVCSLPAGWLADRWSRHGMMVSFFVGIGAASILTGLAGSPLQIALGLTLIGVFGSIYHPVGIAMLVSGRDKVGRVLGVNGVYGNFGVALAAVIAGALAHWISWRAAFIFPGVIAALLGIAFAVMVPDVNPTAKATGGGPAINLSRDIVLRVFVVVIVATVSGGIIFNATTIAMPKVFDQRLGELVSTTLGIGLLVSLVYLFAAMAQLCVGYLIDRIPLKKVLVLTVALQVPLLFLAAFLDNYLMLAITAAMMFFIFGQVPINDAMVAAYSKERWRARAYALRYVVSFTASAVSVPLVAFVYQTTGEFKQLFLILTAMAALAFVASLAYPREVPRAA